MHQMWRLSEAAPQNLGLACTEDGLLLGRTSLVERRDGRCVVRARGEIERLLKCAYDGEPPVDRLMSGLARVASALNVNDQCLARIAANLQMPDLASAAVRDALAAEDSLIKYAGDEGTGAANWNPELHPRTGTPPNPGWFATTGGASHDAPNVHVAANDDPTRRSDASADVDDWVHLPPAKRIDELGDFLEWLANAKPEDEATIRREINRYWGSAGDFHALGTLNFMLSQVLKPGTTRQDRQQILELIDNYSRYDQPKSGNSTITSTISWRCLEADCFRGRGEKCLALGNRRQRNLLKAQRLLPASRWLKPTQRHGNLDGRHAGAISKCDSGARFM